MSVCKKLAAAIFTVVFVAALAAPALGSVGYNRPPAGNALTATSGVAKVSEQISANPNADNIAVRFNNVSQPVSKSTVDTMFSVADSKDLTVLFREIGGNAVVTQIAITQANLANLPAEFDPSVTVAPPALNKLFTSFFANELVTLRGPVLGSEYELCYRLDAKNARNIVVYAYDANSNRYTRLHASKYFLDKNGYVHIFGDGGNYVVSNGTLQLR